MKRFRTFVFGNNGIDYVIYSKQIDGEIIKDMDVYYRGEHHERLIGVLRRFTSKTIQYTDFIEKLAIDDCNASQDTLRYSRTVYRNKIGNITRFRNEMLTFLVKEHTGDWGLLNWNVFKRKDRKNSKKKPSD